MNIPRPPQGVDFDALLNRGLAQVLMRADSACCGTTISTAAAARRGRWPGLGAAFFRRRNTVGTEQTTRAVIASRHWLTAQIPARGVELLPSHANFIFARHPQHDGTKLAAELRHRSHVAC